MTDFADFFVNAWSDGRHPYPWQRALAERLASGSPPSVVAVPTGAGKTATIDALVWALSQQADRPAAERTVGVRIIWAIDRRILVDEVHQRASELSDRLASAKEDATDPLHDMATRLSTLSGGPPLVATRWRGGLDERPPRHGALQPQIITSTVAQVGSRLLFRGYGVGTRSLAVEAGLTGCDSTICLDEAHIAEPFRETVAAIRQHRAQTEVGWDLPGLSTLTITATPHPADDDRIELSDADHAALGHRWDGPKSADLREPESDDDATRIRTLVAETLRYVREEVPTVACVVNTVGTARRVSEALEKELRDEAVEVALLIGPQRPADRRTVLERVRPALFDGDPEAKPLVCVATQTFEVGLDADVAALVTESASATALVQRLGRLNRRGATSGRATIVRDPGRWLYADDEPLAWTWLSGLRDSEGAIDVSVAALDADTTRPAPQRRAHAAALTPETLQLLVQTAPRPAPWSDPDVDPFIRGVESEPAADVTIAWRSDLRLGLSDQGAHGYRQMLLELVPPQTKELLTLSTASARALLVARLGPRDRRTAARRTTFADADLESEMPDPPIAAVDPAPAGIPFLVLRRRELLTGTFAGGGSGDLTPGALEPGDVVLLATTTGGSDKHGLNPWADRTDDVAWDLEPTGNAAPVRLNPSALHEALDGKLNEHEWQDIVGRCLLAEAKRREVRTRDEADAETARLVSYLAKRLPAHQGLARLAAEGLDQDGPRLLLRGIGPADDSGVPLLDEAEAYGTDDVDERPELASADEVESSPAESAPYEGTGLERTWVLVPVGARQRDRDERTPEDPPPTLDDHARDVTRELQGTLDGLELPSRIAASLSLAARAHDHGKADPRIQAFYRHGVPAIAAPLLAKSEFGTADPRTARLASDRAGLPQRLRHEIASAAALADALATEESSDGALDEDLALHLIASHHGLGRPVPPVPFGGGAPRPFVVDAADVKGAARGDGVDGWAGGAWLQRFWSTTDRYGAWGSAYLEALLVLADRTVSSRGA